MHHRLTSVSIAAVLAASVVALPAAADVDIPADQVGTVTGMAWDSDGETLWLAGEETDEGVLVGVSADGEQSRMSWEGDDIQSVQALAIRDGAMYVGDTGNPDGNRDSFTIYRFSNLHAGAKKYRSYVFDFPDTDTDFQAMMVSGKGRIYLVSHGEDAGIYRAPSDPSRKGRNKVERVADAPDGVTDGTFLPDGGTMVLRAADGVHVIDAFSWETKAVETYASEMPAESITATDDETLLIGSAGIMREAQVPTSNTTSTPSPEPQESEGASPDASPSPEASASGQAPPSPSAAPEAKGEQPKAENQPRSTGTIVALVLAGIVGIAAGLVTFFSRA